MGAMLSLVGVGVYSITLGTIGGGGSVTPLGESSLPPVGWLSLPLGGFTGSVVFPVGVGFMNFCLKAVSLVSTKGRGSRVLCLLEATRV